MVMVLTDLLLESKVELPLLLIVAVARLLSTVLCHVCLVWTPPRRGNVAGEKRPVTVHGQ